MPIRPQPSTNAGSISWRRHCQARPKSPSSSESIGVQPGDLRRRVDARREAARAREPAEPDVQHVEQRSDPSQNTGSDEPTRPTTRAMWSTDLVLVAGRRRRRGRCRRRRPRSARRTPARAWPAAAPTGPTTPTAWSGTTCRGRRARGSEVLDVLLDDAAVEPPALLGRGDDGLVVHVPLADDRGQRVGRDDPGDDERDRDDAEQQQRRDRQAAQDVVVSVLRRSTAGSVEAEPASSRLQQAL